MRELALHILDLLQNAVEAGATQVTLVIDEDRVADRLTVIVRDNGRGMDPATAARAANPFFTSRDTRHVGLGLPLFAAAAERADGRLVIRSEPGIGTTVEVTMRLSHPDRQPMGNLADTLLAFLLSDKAPELRYEHRVDGAVFEFDLSEIRDTLGDVPLSHPAVVRWLVGFLAEGESEVRRNA